MGVAGAVGVDRRDLEAGNGLRLPSRSRTKQPSGRARRMTTPAACGQWSAQQPFGAGLDVARAGNRGRFRGLQLSQLVRASTRARMGLGISA